MRAIDYQVRVSSRAKHPRLKLSAHDGLVVIVPNGFDVTRIPSVVESKREWIHRSEERLREESKFLLSEHAGQPPERIALQAIGQDWSVAYRKTDAANVTAVERSGTQLLTYGAILDDALVLQALQRWLSRKTREHLAPWLTSVGRQHGLEVASVTVRNQRTRWASCSTRGTISLNLRLLFLPPELVRYALIHELAHLHEMNHSRRYWTFLESVEPNYRAFDSELRAAWRLVPEWIRPSSKR